MGANHGRLASDGTQAQWEEAFAKYKHPEYRLVNARMDLTGFKHIFFWEYLHRNWGRLMGMVSLPPSSVLAYRGLTGWSLRRAWAFLIGGGLVGVLEWFMLASGFEDMPT